jgi:hypothetical protein
MMARNIILPGTLGTLDTSTLGVNKIFVLQTITGGPASILHFANSSNVDVTLVFVFGSEPAAYGVGANELVRANSDLVLNFQANAQPNNFMALLPIGTNIWAYSANAGMGFIDCSYYYQLES